MTFKRDVVLERLAFLKQAVADLKNLQSLSRQDLKDSKNRWAVERGLQLVAEAVFDVGNHILVGRFGDRPSNYEEIVPGLARRLIIPEELAQKFHRLGGFRNILVHEYTTVDPDKIYDRLQNGLGDIERFISQIGLWLEKS